MKHEDIAATLANLPDDALVTVSVRVGDWLRARQAANGGPEYVSPREAARTLGWTASYWVKRARSIAGAVQDKAGRWRLPLEGCRSHIRSLSQARRPVQPATLPIGLVRSVPRGPQRKAQP